MKTEKEIKEELKRLLKAVEDVKNRGEVTQIQLWAQIEFIKWLGIERKEVA